MRCSSTRWIYKEKKLGVHGCRDKFLLPKTEKYDAVHYMLNEWDGSMKHSLQEVTNTGQQSRGKTQQVAVSLSRETTVLRVAYWWQGGLPAFYSLACFMQVASTSLNIYQISSKQGAAAMLPRTLLSKVSDLLPDRNVASANRNLSDIF